MVIHGTEILVQIFHHEIVADIGMSLQFTRPSAMQIISSSPVWVAAKANVMQCRLIAAHNSITALILLECSWEDPPPM